MARGHVRGKGERVRNSTRIGVTVALATGLLGAIGWAVVGHQADESQAQLSSRVASVETVTGYVAVDVDPFLNDERVKRILQKHGLAVTVTRLGSRDMAAKLTTGPKVDFMLASGVLAGNQIADEARKAGVNIAQSTPFTSPLVIASFEPIADILRTNGVAQRIADRVYTIDMSKLGNVMLARKRWKDLKGSDAYPVQRSVLVATTDVRRSNSAVMFLALMSSALNGDVVTDRGAAEASALKLAELFQRQGFTEAYVNGAFEDYTTIGMGKAPMVFVYEYQMAWMALTRKALRPEMVLVYPRPTIVNKFVCTAVTTKGKALAELLSSDADLQKVAVEYGLRVHDAGLFTAAVAAGGLAVQERINDVVDPPAYELMALMVDVLSKELAK